MKATHSRPADLRRLIAATSAALALPASAVSLDPDGYGQALIYPYYTVNSSAGGNAFNTYLSVVNVTTRGKAVRVRIREGRVAREVLSFNLFLSPNDVWTAAIVPAGEAARVVTRDTSCTDPAFVSSGGLASIDLTTAGYTGANADNFGAGLERTREGFIEMIEMAELSGASAAAISHTSAGIPANCAAVQGRMLAPGHLNPPGGMLAGTLTLINVNNGLDFGLPAVALADLAERPFFRLPADPYPDFAAAEIDPVSIVRARGYAYRSVWGRPQDAVTAALMANIVATEYVLDDATDSSTDLVLTQPTRHYYVERDRVSPPYQSLLRWSPTCDGSGEEVWAYGFNREAAGHSFAVCNDDHPSCRPQALSCAAAAVGPVYAGSDSVSSVLASSTLGLGRVGSSPFGLQFRFGSFRNGWLMLGSDSITGKITSLPSSTRVDLATGAWSTGPHEHRGMPVVGFMVRTFINGVLSCNPGNCQRNYGGAFPFAYRRLVTPPEAF